MIISRRGVGHWQSSFFEGSECPPTAKRFHNKAQGRDSALFETSEFRLPRSGFTTKPRVAQRTLGNRNTSKSTLKGLHNNNDPYPLPCSNVILPNPKHTAHRSRRHTFCIAAETHLGTFPADDA